MATRIWYALTRSTLSFLVLFPIWLGYAIPFFRTRKLGATLDPKKMAKKHRRYARRYYRLAVRMRGGLIKVGQILSTRVDLLPPEWIEELAGLQDEVEPIPFSELEAHVAAGYDEPLDVLFQELGKEAVAAASFGQVHRGVTREGVEVALKIKYPDVEPKLAADLFMARYLVRLFNLFLPKIRLLPIYDEVRRALSTELDYEQEARFTRLIHDSFEGRDGVVIPKVLDELTTRDVICTTWFEGVKITKVLERYPDLDQRRLLERLLGAWVDMMYVDGVFQSDPHPGNLLVRVEDGEPILGVVDFGQVKILDRDFHQKLVSSVMAFAMGNVDMVMGALVSLGLFGEDKVEALTPKVSAVMQRLRDEAPVDMRGLDFARVRDEVLETIDEIDGIVISQELVLYGRTFALLAGVSRAIAPDVNALAIAQPLLTQALLAGGPPQEPLKRAAG